jgi:hypothetical protein
MSPGSILNELTSIVLKVLWLLRLCPQMGLGKTLQTIAFLVSVQLYSQPL